MTHYKKKTRTASQQAVDAHRGSSTLARGSGEGGSSNVSDPAVAAWVAHKTDWFPIRLLCWATDSSTTTRHDQIILDAAETAGSAATRTLGARDAGCLRPREAVVGANAWLAFTIRDSSSHTMNGAIFRCGQLVRHVEAWLEECIRVPGCGGPRVGTDSMGRMFGLISRQACASNVAGDFAKGVGKSACS
ncbi:hypothetical protein INS49_010814 [Diaporthe citri]|uniref:uncharacterized protein n=1 Tax=Diaporthe citri TaxID=83186 RepID=UPI001C7E8126|nr:uncharacterized protein INS49_010814 [Diaporthe citri]KAG6359762.1 hypothetical protein INS49_010814 [Diaporthe citri]